MEQEVTATHEAGLKAKQWEGMLVDSNESIIKEGLSHLNRRVEEMRLI